jgi:hypothetical protein
MLHHPLSQQLQPQLWSGLYQQHQHHQQQQCCCYHPVQSLTPYLPVTAAAAAYSTCCCLPAVHPAKVAAHWPAVVLLHLLLL